MFQNRYSMVAKIYGLMFMVFIVVVNLMTFFKDEGISSWQEYFVGRQEEVVVSGIADSMESWYEENICNRYGWINLSGTFSKICGVRSMYKVDNVNIGDNGYIFGAYKQTSTDYEYGQVVSFAEWLDAKGIDFLYVNEPIKYLDDNETIRQFGLKSYGNQNADLLLKRLSDASVETLDLRDIIIGEGIESWDMFYRTDHHWTVPVGLWAARNIVEELNQKYGVQIDEDVFDENGYQFKEYIDAWLGEQGRRVAASYVGFDDYTLVEPLFDTNLELYQGDTKTAEGNFEILLDKSRLDTSADPYSVGSWHYTYLPGGVNGSKIINNNVQDYKILFLGESYDQVVVPFIALGAHEIDAYVLRNTDISVRDIVEKGDYDIVIMAYAQLDLGAHDDPENANYRMYELE